MTQPETPSPVARAAQEAANATVQSEGIPTAVTHALAPLVERLEVVANDVDAASNKVTMLKLLRMTPAKRKRLLDLEAKKRGLILP